LMQKSRFVVCYFFFQAEDGIRDRNVTGVQTCALPISLFLRSVWFPTAELAFVLPVGATLAWGAWLATQGHATAGQVSAVVLYMEIGRASCRERVGVWVGAGAGSRRGGEKDGGPGKQLW